MATVHRIVGKRLAKAALVWSAGTLASGFLLHLALPAVGWWRAGWFCWVPALSAVRGQGLAAGFASGMTACLFAAWLAAVGLFEPRVLVDQDPGWIYGGYALFGLVAGLALGCWGATRLWEWRPWAWAGLAVLLEAGLLLYLPAHLALTQYRSTLLLALASVTGIWGVSFLVWLANASVAVMVSRRDFVRLAPVLVAAILIGTPWAARGGEGEPVSVGLVQTEETDMTALKRLHTNAREAGARLCLWPELSGSVAAPWGQTDRLVAWAARRGQPPYITTYLDDFRPPHNVASLFDARGESGRYAKRKPFAGEAAERTPGDRAVSVGWEGHRIGLLVCFDSCFPWIARQAASQPGVDLVAVPTLDPQTPHGVIQSLHAAFLAFRAAENGVPFLRSDKTSASLATDCNGRLLAVLPAGERVAVVKVTPARRRTPYRVLGDWFLMLASGGWLFGLLWNRRSKDAAACIAVPGWEGGPPCLPRCRWRPPPSRFARHLPQQGTSHSRLGEELLSWAFPFCVARRSPVLQRRGG